MPKQSQSRGLFFFLPAFVSLWCSRNILYAFSVPPTFIVLRAKLNPVDTEWGKCYWLLVVSSWFFSDDLKRTVMFSFQMWLCLLNSHNRNPVSSPDYNFYNFMECFSFHQRFCTVQRFKFPKPKPIKWWAWFLPLGPDGNKVLPSPCPNFSLYHWFLLVHAGFISYNVCCFELVNQKKQRISPQSNIQYLVWFAYFL